MKKKDNGYRFMLGRLLATQGAIKALADAGDDATPFLLRHRAGDWGELDSEDRVANESAIRYGLRILSAYKTSKGERIWIITEADRSVTTILLPEEY